MSEPQRIGEILPEVMLVIKARMERQRRKMAASTDDGFLSNRPGRVRGSAARKRHFAGANYE
ncbi:MAG: hypothetical protein HQ580_14705 [Planctomycetes bacterium]|nr:hypothetical protein [Planctomycetota bacterium]